MRPQAKKVFAPLLFLALVVISIVIVRFVGQNEDSSMLTVDNGPPAVSDDELNDDGLRTVQDDEESNVNTTNYTAPPTYLPTYLPTMTPTAGDSTNTPPTTASPQIEQSSSIPSIRPTASSSGRPSSLPNYSPNKGTINPTSAPVKSPSPNLTTSMKTSQPTSPGTNKPTTRSPSSAMPSLSLTPSSKSPITSDPTTTYHATKGCTRQNKNDSPSSTTPNTTCIPAEHTSKLAVNCCSGSQSTNNLTCKRKGCFKTKSYIAAQDHCSQAGMRLCTSSELTSGICCDEGCGFNSRLSWAEDVCAPTMSPTDGPTGEPTFSPTQVPSDSPTDGPTGEPTFSPTPLPSHSPTDGPTGEPTPSPTQLPTQSPTDDPTSEPTSSPTQLPTQSPTTKAGTLINFNTGDRSVGSNETSTVGIIFEVQALRDLAITSLSTFTESENRVWSEVWIRQGRYQGFTTDNAGWRRIYFKRSQHYGFNVPLDIVFGDNEQVYIPEGQIMSFYLISPGKFLSDQGIVEGTVIAEDNSLKLYTGAAIDYGRFGEGCKDDRDCIFPARIFNGAISYATSTMPPTSQPTPDPFELKSSGLTLREEQWLDSHNVRRKKWHEMYGKKYKPLKWSEGLKDMAQLYADLLASKCGPTVHDSYENREGYGENLASNTGRDRGAESWGELKPVERVMSRFVERESTWEPPDNGHFTQVLWYATTHVGCADSVGTKSKGLVCRYQVCRYARAGNCGIRSFDDGSKDWWMKAVMQDSSNCQPFCPPEGC